MLRHRAKLLAIHPAGERLGAAAAERLDHALRCALTNLMAPAAAMPVAPPEGTDAALRYWRDRISVPRDMPLHAARRLRAALERTAALAGPEQGPPLPVRDRRDQNPAPFVALSGR
jgi:glutathione S-transferase